uniref:Uncharacterized protein n=1 Tax=Tanacetum cinerariifolium TaxID=118510 RepID=A0A6L2KVR7_TANCI|nr:hypothetical protein [Tanacetum cinerariifolium]
MSYYKTMYANSRPSGLVIVTTGVSPGVPDESAVFPTTSSEGTGTKLWVPDEENVTSEANVILEWGSKKESEYFKEEDDDKTIEWVDTEEEEETKDDDDDKSNDLELKDDEETDDKFIHGDEHVLEDDEETDDEFVHGDEQVNYNENEEMTNAEVEAFGNDDEEISDAAKVDAEKNEEVNDDANKAVLPPTSSSLSVSLGFGDQFLKLLYDTSLIGTVKDTTDAEINSLLNMMTLNNINRYVVSTSWIQRIDLSTQNSILTSTVQMTYLFFQTIRRATVKWFKKDCIGSVTTWDDLVRKFVQKFFQISDHNEEIVENDDPDDITNIFKIEGNLFDFETPLCKAFNDFNYLLKIYKDFFTFDTQGTRTYEEYKLNNPMTMDLEEPWLDNGCHINYVIIYVNHVTVRMARDPYLKINNIFNRNYDTSNTQDNQRHEERRDDPTLEPLVCKIKRFKVMKYSFNADEEYIAIKESEYLNHLKDNLDAYRELLRTIRRILGFGIRHIDPCTVVCLIVFLHKEIRHISAKSSQEKYAFTIPNTTYSPSDIRRIHEDNYSEIRRYYYFGNVYYVDHKLCAHSKGYTPIRRIGLAQYGVSRLFQRFYRDTLQKNYSVKPAPEPSKIQTPTIDLEPKTEKSALKIHKIKKEQSEKQKMLKYTIKSINKATLKKYDQKSALYQIHDDDEDEDVDLSTGPNQGPVYNLLKGTCTSSIKLEYNMEEFSKALTDRLDWNNPKRDCCPFDLTKPLPLKGHLCLLTVATEYFFNNDLEFLKSSNPKK